MPSAPSCPVGFCKELQTASAQVARHQKQFDSVRSLDNTFCNWHCAALRAIFARYSHMKQTITLTHCISDTLHFCSFEGKHQPVFPYYGTAGSAIETSTRRTACLCGTLHLSHELHGRRLGYARRQCTRMVFQGSNARQWKVKGCSDEACWTCH